LFAREAQRVLCHRRLDRRAHRRGSAKEAVRRRHALERLMRALEVVMLYEQPHAALTILEVRKHGAREELLPHRLPEPLDLPAGLRMMGSALNVRDPVAMELRLELRGTAPRSVLPTLIGENLAGCSILGNPTLERLEHQHTTLVMGECQADQISRVIVQKCRHVQSLVLAQ
jgi:hypothetical protein